MIAPPGIARQSSSTQRFDPARPGPQVSQQARDRLDDLGLVDNDHTPDMRRAPAATGALHQQMHHHEVTTTTKEEI